MHPKFTQTAVLTHLQQLIGLPLAAAGRAADMRMLTFGKLREFVQGSAVGEFALHIQCPWRIDNPEGIFTGRMDLFEPIEEGQEFEYKDWDDEQNPNVQDFRINCLLKDFSTTLIVASIEADDWGGAAIQFANNFVLRLFPAGTRGEDWRLFCPKTDTPHFVIVAGRVELDESKSTE